MATSRTIKQLCGRSTDDKLAFGLVAPTSKIEDEITPSLVYITPGINSEILALTASIILSFSTIAMFNLRNLSSSDVQSKPPTLSTVLRLIIEYSKPRFYRYYINISRYVLTTI